MSGAAAVAADGRLAAYDFGPDRPFQAGRLDAGLSLLRAAKLLDDDDLLAFAPADDADLELIHDRDYLEALARFSAPGPAPPDPAEAARFGLVGDNRPFPGMDEAARLVAGATMAAVDAVAAGDLAHVFAPVAGLHHAQRRRAVGFCLVNDAAVAIARCTRAWPLRVLYVDLDAHHGDGVQAAFYDDPRVCTVSLHETGRYLFPGSGEVHELGRPPGTGAQRERAPRADAPGTTASWPHSTPWSSRWPPRSGPTCWSPRTAATAMPPTRSATSP